MTEHTLLQLIRQRFSAPEYAVMFKVTDGTGSSFSRIADAVAMNLWPSRGAAVHGFECKISRADWLSELRKPEKADPIARFCEYWWIVAPKDIIKPGELPETWGHLYPRGNTLHIAVKAPKLNAQPLDKLFIGAMLRRAAEDTVPKAQIAQELQAKYAEGHAAAEKHAMQHMAANSRAALIELEQLKKALAAFELESGVKIGTWDAGKIGSAVQAVLSCRYTRDRLVSMWHEAKNHAASAQRMADSLAKTLEENPHV